MNGTVRHTGTATPEDSRAPAGGRETSNLPLPRLADPGISRF
jgi:hypothetical protein